MSQQSTLKHRREPWKRKATERAEHHRSRRKELARIRQERDRLRHAHQETQECLRQHEAHTHGLVVNHKVDLVWRALRLFWEVRISFRAVARVLQLLAEGCGITKAPCPQTVINWVTRLAIVRGEAARRLRGLPLGAAPFSNGLIWMMDISMGVGTGKIWAVVAGDAQHHQRVPEALALDRVHCSGVAVADSWTGDTIAAWLGRLIAHMGRPAAYLKDGGSDWHKAVAVLEERGLASPCIDDISHAVAGMLKRSSHDHPTFATFVAACGRVSGQLKHTILACLAPPKVHTKARFMNVHRFFTWAERLLTLSPPGGAKSGSPLGRLRACLDQLPACTSFIKRLRGDAAGLLACQQMLKTTGLSHATLAQCLPLIDAMPSPALRQEFHASLAFELETAQTLGLDHVGVPISSDAIESLFGVAKHHGVGETQDAARIALRLPAFCGSLTREEAEQVLDISVARQQALTGQVISLTKQRREVLGHPERLERLRLTQGDRYVALIPSPKTRANYQEIIPISNSYEKLCDPQLSGLDEPLLLENAAPPSRRETALTS